MPRVMASMAAGPSAFAFSRKLQSWTPSGARKSPVASERAAPVALIAPDDEDVCRWQAAAASTAAPTRRKCELRRFIARRPPRSEWGGTRAAPTAARRSRLTQSMGDWKRSRHLLQLLVVAVGPQ